MPKKVTISAIVPVFNEAENIRILLPKLKKGLAKVDKNYEIIFIDDGSSDKSKTLLKDFYKKEKSVSVLLFDQNYGKPAAQEAGIKIARGDLIVTIDSDLQHDPGEIIKLVDKINQGYDLVMGWRKKRRDLPHRVAFSKIVNYFVFLFTGFKARDFYCGFKCFRKEVVKELELYGDLCRFIAYLAFLKGFKVAEVPISYHYRRYGRSQSALKFTKRAIYDLLIIFFVIKNLQKGQYKIKERLIRKS
jgi:glycosyltransferase involved in cell wall biosynthesis